jgi:hypothetical protein
MKIITHFAEPSELAEITPLPLSEALEWRLQEYTQCVQIDTSEI